MPFLLTYIKIKMKDTLKSVRNILKKQYLNTTQLYYNIAGNKVECNICHYKANKLKSNNWHLFSSCPNCGSGVRNRLIFAALAYLDDLKMEKLIKGKKVLHFAPESAARKVLKSNAGVYKTADYLVEGYNYGNIDYNIDISDMKEVESNSFDCVIACDVLEHVPRHIDGIKEVNRVLKKGGYCIFTIPQKDGLVKTYEDLSITNPAAREKAFGQPDHLRIYGSDFADTVKDAGFEVKVIDETFFDKAIVEKYVLFPPVLSKNPLATNYRKVFFGKKI